MGSQLGVFFSYVLFDRSFHGNAMSTSYSSCLFIVMIVQKCWIARYCSRAQPSGGLAV